MRNARLSLAITAAVSAVYLPVIGARTLRFAGDEKSYLDQIIEMQDRSAWFTQTFAGEPNYYKGPFHYLAVRACAALFGNQFFSALLPNFILLVLGAVSIGLTLIHFQPQKKREAFFGGVAFATCAGLYSHGLASQMEVELAGFFAIGMAALAFDRSLLFWLISGGAGWIKSPLHSVLLGASGLLYWLIEGSFSRRMKDLRQWRYLIMGILFCSAGYAPAFFLDHDNFIRTYIRRETLDKPGNSSEWWVSIVPIISHSVFPWTVMIWVAIADLARRLFARLPIPRAAVLGIAICAPALTFFLIHPYRVHTYNLPIIAGLALLVASLASIAEGRTLSFYRLSLAISCVALALVCGAAVFVLKKVQIPFFEPYLVLLCGISSIGSALAAARILTQRTSVIEWISVLAASSAIVSFISIGLILRSFGTWEIHRLNQAIDSLSQRQSPSIYYYDPSKSVWHEWGLMEFATTRKIRPLYSAETVATALKHGDIVISQNPVEIRALGETLIHTLGRGHLKVEPWPRWRRPAEKTNGVPNWKVAWQASDWTLLVTEYAIIRMTE